MITISLLIFHVILILTVNGFTSTQIHCRSPLVHNIHVHVPVPVRPPASSSCCCCCCCSNNINHENFQTLTSYQTKGLIMKRKRKISSTELQLSPIRINNRYEYGYRYNNFIKDNIDNISSRLHNNKFHHHKNDSAGMNGGNVDLLEEYDDDDDDDSDDVKYRQSYLPSTTNNKYHPLEQLFIKRKTKKMEWLINVTSQILYVDSSTKLQQEQQQQHVCQPSYPIGSLPSSLITKIPTIMITWMHRCSIENSNAAFIVERLLERLIDERGAGNDYFSTTQNHNHHSEENDYNNTSNNNNNNNNSGKQIITMNRGETDEKMITTDLYNIVIEAWTRTSGTNDDNYEQYCIIANNCFFHGKGLVYDATNIDVNNKISDSDDDGNCSNGNNGNNGNNSTSTMISSESTSLASTQQLTTSIPFAAMRAHQILNKMEELSYNESGIDDNSTGVGDINVQPDTKTYSLVLKAWARSKEYCSLSRMEEILNRLEEVGSYSNYHDVQPTVQCFNLYLYALANCEKQLNENNKNDSVEIMNHAKKAHGILLDLKKRYEEDSIRHGNMLPDVNTYNQVLSAYARTKTMEGAIEAQSILDDMMKEANVTNVYPDTDTFNAVMGCWHKCPSKQASFNIEYILNLMNGLSQTVVGYHRARPDRFSVNTAIVSIGRSRRKEKLQRVHYILKNMERLYNVKPDTISYNIVIDAYSKSSDIRAVKQTRRLLTTMQDLYMNGDDLVKPDSFSYSTVIDTMCTRLKNRATQEAESIVEQMEELSKHGCTRPSTAVYNSLMNCYATHGDKNDLNRLEMLLTFMEINSDQGNIHMKPNIITYNTALKGYSLSKDNLTRKAEALLDRMESKELDVFPDIISYTTTITTFARSSLPGKARNAKRILDKMIDMNNSGENPNIQISIYPFNACLNACAYTFNRQEKVMAFKVVVDTLVLTRKFCKPDHTTYGTILKAWRTLIPKHDDTRQSVVTSSFKQCCEEGFAGQLVMRQLQLAASPEVYNDLVGKYIKGKTSSFPSSWSRNVKER